MWSIQTHTDIVITYFLIQMQYSVNFFKVSLKAEDVQIASLDVLVKNAKYWKTFIGKQ